jgi:hypothetical protein
MIQAIVAVCRKKKICTGRVQVHIFPMQMARVLDGLERVQRPRSEHVRNAFPWLLDRKAVRAS